MTLPPSSQTGAPRWRAHTGVLLLIAVEALTIIALSRAPATLLVESLVALALAVAASHGRVGRGLLVAEALACLALALVAALTPGALPPGLDAALGAALSEARRSPPAPLAVAVVIASAKLAAIALTIVWFGALTSASELLDFLALVSARVPPLRAPLYMLSTLLAALPAIQSDLRASVDAAIIRGGGRAALLSPVAWVDALTGTIARVVARARRLASSAIARGFRLADGLTSLAPRLTRADWLLAAGAVLLGAVIVEVAR